MKTEMLKFILEEILIHQPLWMMKLTDISSSVFSVVIYGCESRIIKKTECQRFDVFELW